MPVFNNALAGAAAGGAADFKIERSLRFNDSDSAHLNNTFGAGNYHKWTWAAWVKRNKLGGYQTLFGHVSGGSGQHYIDFGGDKIRFTRYVSSNEAALETSARYRDTSAWMHVCAIWDVGNSTANHRQRLFINGLEVTEFSTRTNPSQHYNGGVINSAIEHHISKVLSQNYGAFQLADVHFLDGIVAGISTDDAAGSVTGTPNAAYLTDFGEFDADTGVWNPIEYRGDYRQPVNQTQTWSSFGGSGTYSSAYDWTKLFDGDFDSKTVPANGSSITADFTSLSGGGIAYTSSLEVHYRRNTSAPDVTVNGSGINAPANGANNIYKVTGSGTLTSVGTQQRTTAGAGDCSLFKIVIDGKELVDQGVTPISNGFHLDFDPTAGVVYSDAVQNANNAATNLFDGSLSSYTEGSTDGTAVTWTGNVTGNTIEFYGAQNAGTRTFSVNNVDRLSLVPTTAGWFTIPNTTSLTSFSFSRGAPSGGFVDLYAIRVDGKILVDHEAPGVDASGSGNHWTANNLDGYTQQSPMATTAHRYWRAVLYDYNGSHWPRMSKLYMYEADGTRHTHKNYTGDNCSDQGSIPTNGGVYDTDYGSGNSYSFRNVGIYSTYNGGNRNGLAKVYYSDDGSNWTYSFKTIVETNAQCGERTGTVIAELVNGDIVIDSPTNYEASSGNNGGNYCTLNPLQKSSEVTLSNGNLDVSTSSTSNKCKVFGTMAVTSGKWYYEVTIGSNYRGSFGWATDPNSNLAQQPGDSTGDYALTFDGQKVKSGSYTGSYGTAYSSDMVIGIRLDATAGTVAFSQDGVDKGNAYTGQTGLTWWPIVGDASSGGTFSGSVNFGQYPFKYPPGGTGGPAATFKSLCTQNLDDPLIDKGSDHFDTSLWTGNGQQMTVGGPIWSASADSSVTNAGYIFNGDSNNGGYYNGTGTNKVLTTSPFTINTQLRVYNNFRSDGTYAICLNDSCINVPGSGTSSANFRWSTVDLSSFSLPLDVTKLGYSLSQNSGNTIKLIEVDGTVLIDGNGDPLDFSPDFVWLKSRSTTAYHMLFDTTRGAEARLHSNTTTQEQTGNGDLTAFNSNGYTLDNATGSTNTDVNGSGTSYVGWAWEGGDLVTNSAYNQSQVWSSGTQTNPDTSRPLSNLFDNDTVTLIAAASGNNASSKVTFPASITAQTSVRYWSRAGGYNNGATTLSNNGTTVSTIAAENSQSSGWKSFTGTFPMTFNEITFNRSSDGTGSGAAAIEVDGKVLVDKGLVPAGSLNSSVYDQSQTWSTYGSVTAGSFSPAITELFDNDLTSGPSSGAGTTSTWTFTSGITASSSIEIYCVNGSGPSGTQTSGTEIRLTVGGTVHSIDGSPGWINTGLTGSLTAVTIHVTAGSGSSGLRAIKVDGKELVDFGVTVTNVPSVAATVRANPTAGFSIVNAKFPNYYTNYTVPHGLNSTPHFIVGKNRLESNQWDVYHQEVGTGKLFRLNQTSSVSNATANQDSYYPTAPNSNVFGFVGNNTNMEFIWYVFTEIEGYSAFGKYTGNGSSDGPFVYTGFRPAFIIVKRTGGTARNWVMIDTARSSFNEADEAVYPNLASAEDTGTDWADILSNGFKTRNNNASWNTSGAEYAYFCWAENPFKYARAR